MDGMRVVVLDDHQRVAAAPGHVRTVVNEVLDPLKGRDVGDLDRIMRRILDRLTEPRE